MCGCISVFFCLVFSLARRKEKVVKEIKKSVCVCVLMGVFIAGEQFVILDLPLLYESNKCTNYLFKTIVVTW